jgi:hypothetical protein
MANERNLNPSPKLRFLEIEANAKAHHDLIARMDLQRSLDAALAQYQLLLSLEAKDANAAAAAHFKITGVLEFMHIFKYLAEMAPPPKPTPLAKLDFNA